MILSWIAFILMGSFWEAFWTFSHLLVFSEDPSGFGKMFWKICSYNMEIMHTKWWKIFWKWETLWSIHFWKIGASRGKNMACIVSKLWVKTFLKHVHLEEMWKLEKYKVHKMMHEFYKLCIWKMWSFTKLWDNFEMWILTKVCFFKHGACSNYVKLLLMLFVFR